MARVRYLANRTEGKHGSDDGGCREIRQTQLEAKEVNEKAWIKVDMQAK